MCKLQSIHPKQNQKQIRMRAMKPACFKLEEKATRSVKNNKNSFISIIGEKFALSIRWEKLTISFCKKLLLYKLSSVTYTSNKISNWRFNNS